MGNWFSSEEKITVNNNQLPKSEKIISEDTMKSSLNLSIEEVLKECAIVVAIVLFWEFLKNKINKRAEKLALTTPTI